MWPQPRRSGFDGRDRPAGTKTAEDDLSAILEYVARSDGADRALALSRSFENCSSVPTASVFVSMAASWCCLPCSMGGGKLPSC